MSSTNQTRHHRKTSSKRRLPQLRSKNPNSALQQPIQPDLIIQRARSDPASLTAADVRHLQRALGNQAAGRFLAQAGQSQLPHKQAAASQGPSAQNAANTIQRAFTTFPVAFVGNDLQTAHSLLRQYITSAPVATGGKKFQEEYQRVLSALEKIQPSKAKELAGRLQTVGMTKKPQDAPADAAKLEGFVNYINGLIATYQLDAARAAITARVEVDESHHPTYYFKLPGDNDEKMFDLDDWSRKGKDFLQGASSGQVIQSIVNEAVTDWDPDKGSIVSLLVERLLGTKSLAESGKAQTVSGLFMNSPVGQNYTRILMAAQYIIGVRTADLKPRGVKVEHWKKNATNVKDNKEDGTVDWPALLKTARATFKEKMKTTAAANQDEARKIAVKSIAQDADIARLKKLRVLKVDETEGKFSLDNNAQKHGNDIYRAIKDERFNFDINHFTAILFFEWKAVTDLKQ